MRYRLTSILAITTTLFLAACDTNESDSVRSNEQETVGSQIADDYNRQMDRARNVEIELQDKMERVEDALREADSQAAKDP